MGALAAAVLGALNDTLDVPCGEADWVALDATGGGGTSTVTVTGSVDGVTFRVLPIINITTAGAVTAGGGFSGASAAATYVVPAIGLKIVRIKMTAFTSGSCAIVATASSGNMPYPVNTQMPQLSSAVIASTTGTGGFTWHKGASTGATTVGVNAKSASGNLHHLVLMNNQAATDAYFKMFSKASAPTVGTDTPIAKFYMPPKSCIPIPLDFIRANFAAGIGYAFTGGPTDLDATAVAADTCFCQLLYA